MIKQKNKPEGELNLSPEDVKVIGRAAGVEQFATIMLMLDNTLTANSSSSGGKTLDHRRPSLISGLALLCSDKELLHTE